MAWGSLQDLETAEPVLNLNSRRVGYYLASILMCGVGKPKSPHRLTRILEPKEIAAINEQKYGKVNIPVYSQICTDNSISWNCGRFLAFFGRSPHPSEKVFLRGSLEGWYENALKRTKTWKS